MGDSMQSSFYHRKIEDKPCCIIGQSKRHFWLVLGVLYCQWILGRSLKKFSAASRAGLAGRKANAAKMLSQLLAILTDIGINGAHCAKG